MITNSAEMHEPTESDILGGVERASSMGNEQAIDPYIAVIKRKQGA